MRPSALHVSVVPPLVDCVVLAVKHGTTALKSASKRIGSWDTGAIVGSLSLPVFRLLCLSHQLTF